MGKWVRWVDLKTSPGDGKMGRFYKARMTEGVR